MFRNYFTIAVRNLLRQKAFSAINILGLSIGIATCLVIILFVGNELSYDRYNEKADRIVRVVFRASIQGEKINEANVFPPVAQTLQRDYPEVLDATRLRNYGTPRMTYGDKSFKEDALAFVDANFFQVFTLPLLKGDPKMALVEPNTIVISQATAQKYFGNEDPIGKVLTFKDFGTTGKITGLMKNMPANSHFHFDLFGSMSSLPGAKEPSWMTSEFYTYLVLPDGYDYKQLEAKLPQTVSTYMSPQLQQAMGMDIAQFRKSGNDIGLFLQPLTDIHLHSDLKFELKPGGDIRYVYIFGAIAFFMLLIACINFMNLSTAGAAKRGKEVGIRKVLGSVKGQLVGQFLLESVLLTAVALLVALGLVVVSLPFFNELAGQNLTFQFITNPYLLIGLLLFGLLVGVLAGSYPAFFLSSFNPVAVLKGRFSAGKKSIGLRSGLVVFQFCISIALMVCTTVVYQQLAYIQQKKLGYDKNQVLLLGETYVLGNKEEVLRQQLRQDPRVASVSTSGYLPAGPSNNNNFFVYPNDDPSQQIKTLRYDVDDQYIPTLGMEMVAGRNFSKAFATDSSGVILNETAAKALGWKNDALDRTITRSDNQGEKVTYRVIGVVKDFHFRSLHERISPLVMVLARNSGSIIVKAKTTDIASLVTSIKKQWTALTPGEPFTYAFLDERFNQTYQAEQTIGRILGIFAGLTIFVACLGLFGLATFTATQRTKEIGIRKVLGASVPDITLLLSKDFLKLVLIAFVIAAPIAWYAMSKWLEDFAYRVDIGTGVFVITGVAAFLIALLTVSYQAIKAAVANPVDSLRSE